MSENVELVRSIFAAREGGDFGSAGWADPEIEYVIADGPWAVNRTGLAEMAKGEPDFLNTFDDFRIAASDYREIDGEPVVVLCNGSGRGKASGLDIEMIGPKVGACLFHVRDGKVIRFVGYRERDRAFADLGLEG